MAGTESSNENQRTTPVWDADDVKLSAALGRVSVPSGAKQRAMARLRLEGLLRPDEAHTDSAVSASILLPSQLDEAFSPKETPVEASVEAPVEAMSVGDAGTERVTPEAQRSVAALRSSRRISRRAMVGLAAFMAVAAASLLIYVRSLPLAQSQLTAYCSSALDRLLVGEPPAWQETPRELASQRLAPLLGKFSQPLTLVGSLQIDVPELAKGCTLYKFTARNGTLQVYVFDYSEPRRVAGLVGQLQTLATSSSSWSLAAMQGPDQLLVVATEGDLQRFFRTLQLA